VENVSIGKSANAAAFVGVLLVRSLGLAAGVSLVFLLVAALLSIR
jgi:hypothetical protein